MINYRQVPTLSYYTISCLNWFIFLITFSYNTYSRDFTTRTYTVNDGLTYNYVQDITQDSTGFLWIATWDGINRFDGYDFRNYYHRPNDTTTFPFFPVDKLLVDSQNDLWVLCTFRPLFRYDRKHDHFERFYPTGDAIFTDIDLDADGTLWMVNTYEVYGYSPAKKTLKKLSFTNELAEPFVFGYKPQMVFDNNQNIWFFDYHASGYKVYKSTMLNDSILSISRLCDIDLSSQQSFNLKHAKGDFQVFSSNESEHWIFSKYGLFLCNSESKKITGMEIPEFTATGRSLPEYRWIDDFKGIGIFTVNTGEIRFIPNQSGLFYQTMFSDRVNNVWAGTASASRNNLGLYRFNEIPGYFKHYLTGPNEMGNPNLVFPLIKDLYQKIWVGTRGLDYIFRISPDRSAEKISFLKVPPATDHPRVRSMVADSAGIWLGCTNNYLVYYNFASQEFSTLNSEPLVENGVSTPLSVHNVIKKGKDLVFSGYEGVYTLSPDNNQIRIRYKTEIKANIYTMVGDGNNGIWLGINDNTIIHLDSSFNETGKYRTGTERNHVEHICPGDSNDVWIAFMGGGLGHFVPSSGETEIYTTADGLSNNTLYSILKDKRGDLWISTNQGISLFNPRTRIFRNFGEAEGLYIHEFNSDAFFQSADGEFFFGGVGGFVSFFPDSIYSRVISYPETPMVITGFRVSGKERRFAEACYDQDTFLLEKGDNNFQLTFANINFQHANKIRYRYRLLEKDEEWVETDFRHRNVNYSNLLPGLYHFSVQSTNPIGEWMAEKQIVIEIPFKFYQTVWFRVLILMMILGIIAFAGMVVIRQMNLKARQKRDELKLESLAGQMNPHFIFNSLNSINYFISNNDKVSANHYIADFSKLIRSILDNLSADYVPFDKELETIRNYLHLEHLRFGDKFSYKLDAGDSGLIRFMVVPGLVQPFIENAIWHGVRGIEDRKGFVNISFVKISDSVIQCIVEDDGVGRKLSESRRHVFPVKTSKGIGIVRERLKIISQLRSRDYRLIIEDMYTGILETGTRVIIDLPVKEKVKT